MRRAAAKHLLAILSLTALALLARPLPTASQDLSEEWIAAAESVLRAALAGDRERSYEQIITDVVIIRANILDKAVYHVDIEDDILQARDESHAIDTLLSEEMLRRSTVDTNVVYDLVVRYDPERYRDRRIGLYPVSFEDQFIVWARRMGMYTRSTTLTSGRIYLHDVTTSRQSWIYAHDARALYSPDGVDFPPPTNASDPMDAKRWLKLIHGIPKTISLATMTRWLRLIHNEPRDIVVRREQRLQRDSGAGASADGVQ